MAMENVSPRNAESVKDDHQHQKVIKPHQPIFGNRVYLSHPENTKCFYREPPALFNSIKATSEVSEDSNLSENPEVKGNKLRIPASSSIIDSSTQTSKTILQLAKLEVGRLSPDSLMQSPRNPEILNNANRGNLEQLESKFGLCCMNPEPTLSSCTLEGSVYEQENPSLTYVRKNNLKECLDNYEPSRSASSYEDISVFPKQSLTEAFLTKKKNDDKATMCNCRSMFLQQTSPLRNLTIESPKSRGDHFRSQSYIDPCNSQCEQSYTHPQKLPCQISRFTVKGVKEQFIEKTQPIQYSWKSEPTNVNIADNSRVQFIENDHHEQSCINNGNFLKIDHSPKSYSGKRNSPNMPSTFMSPTIASEQRNQSRMVQQLQHLISPTRRGKSMSPSRNPTKTYRMSKLAQKSNTEKIPYIDQSHSNVEVAKTEAHKAIQWRKNISHREPSPKTIIASLATRPKFDEDLLKIDLQSLEVKMSGETLCGAGGSPSCSSSTTSTDNILLSTLNRIRDPDWNVALKGLAEMTELCRMMDPDLLYPHMITVNQKLLALLRSPRSHVCRTACQAAGHFFESMKDTRRPEFDDIVENLLCKTADTNKFIRKDANLSLDCMVTHIPIYHAVRSLCLKGPLHKNALVRTATIRLIVCAVVIAGPDVILNVPTHEHTRKRVILHLAKFLGDKNLETRKYGERLYKILCKDLMFEPCLRRYLEKDEISAMKITLKCKNQKR